MMRRLFPYGFRHWWKYNPYIRGMKRTIGFVLLPITWPLGLIWRLVVKGFVLSLIFILQKIGPDRSADAAAWIARKIGPRIRVAKLGRANLRAAYPEKTDEEIEKILTGVFDNLGRVAGEFVHLGKLWDWDENAERGGRITISKEVSERFLALRERDTAAVVFTGHLANWELCAVAAAAHGLKSSVVFRPPNNQIFEEIIERTRSGVMGEMIRSERQSVFTMAGVLERGRILGVLVDQYFQGVPIKFFGRQTRANPLAARLARQFDCPVYGARVIRLPEGRFALDLTEPLDLPRDKDGKIDVDAATQTINAVVEGWIREYPEQWLWLHRRWR